MAEREDDPISAARTPAVPARPGRAGPARPLRIAFLSHRSSPHSGGQGVYLRHLTRALAALGHHVDVLSGPPYPDLAPGIGLIRLPGAAPATARDRRPEDTDTPQAFAHRVAEHLRGSNQRYDIVHDNQTLAPGILDLAKAGFTVVATIHHPVTIDRRHALDAAGGWLARWRVRRAFRFVGTQARVARRLARIVTVSECSKEDIAREFGVARDRITVIHNGIDTETFRPFSDHRRQAGRIITTVSDDIPHKGLAYLLPAFALVLREQPEAELVIVGRPRAGSGTNTMIAKLRIGGRVRFTGPLAPAEIARAYSEAEIAVVPSLYEGFGLPAGEAMACGVPVVATRGGALPEVVGEAGVLVPPANSPVLARALLLLLSDPVRRVLLGAQGRARILHAFNWEHAAAALVEVYRDVLAQAETPPAKQ